MSVLVCVLYSISIRVLSAGQSIRKLGQFGEVHVHVHVCSTATAMCMYDIVQTCVFIQTWVAAGLSVLKGYS